jgi:hypothetical protein
MKLKVNSRQAREFHAKVEARLGADSLIGKGYLKSQPRRKGETADDLVNAAAHVFLRWLQLEQAAGRQIEGPPPKGRGRNGHWGYPITSRRNTKAARQGNVTADEPGQAQRQKA